MAFEGFSYVGASQCSLAYDCMICRLGVRSAALHDIYSPAVTQALKSALLQFDRKLPGFISDAGLLHGVETRTSSPVSGFFCSIPYFTSMLGFQHAYGDSSINMFTCKVP